MAVFSFVVSELSSWGDRLAVGRGALRRATRQESRGCVAGAEQDAKRRVHKANLGFPSWFKIQFPKSEPGLLNWQPVLGGSSSGRTADSDSANLGSNPSPPAKKNNPALVAGFFFFGSG